MACAFASSRSAPPHAPPLLTLRHAAQGYTVAMVDQRGQPLAPDFRRQAGVLREAIREYEAERRRSVSFLPWSAAGSDATMDGRGIEPSSRLVDLAPEAGVPTAAEAEACSALGSRHVLLGQAVFEVADLGSEWRGLAEAGAVVKIEHLHLSTQGSRFPGVEPSCEGYAISKGRALIVSPVELDEAERRLAVAGRGSLAGSIMAMGY